MKNTLVLTALCFTALTARADWNAKATAMLNDNFISTNSENLARSIITDLHPTANSYSAALEKFQVRPSGNDLTVRFDVTWESAYKHSYKTVVVWQFNQSGHVSATVLGETSIIKASPEAEKNLDKYFRLEIYPALCSSIK